MGETTSEITAEEVQEERRRLLFLNDGSGVLSEEDAAVFVEERGFIHLFAPKGLPWPNLCDAELRARGSLDIFSLEVWHWKNTLPARKRCAYGHFLRKRGIFISWQHFPAFRQLWGLHSPVDRVLESGCLDPVERQMLQVVAIQGPIRSRDLRMEVQGAMGAKKRDYQAALRRLQERFLITVAGGSVEGFSMHDWDLVERHVPPDALALPVAPEEARRKLVCQAVENAPYCTAREIALLFGWECKQVEALLGKLAGIGLIHATRVRGLHEVGFHSAG
jgi:hypothetical protein